MNTITPSSDLYDRIIQRINYEQRLLIIKRMLFYYAMTLVISVAIAIPSFMKLYSDMVSSGLIQFVSLLFSDFTIVMSNFGDFMLSILEALPIISSVLISLVIAFAIFSFNKFYVLLFEIINIRQYQKT